MGEWQKRKSERQVRPAPGYGEVGVHPSGNERALRETPAELGACSAHTWKTFKRYSEMLGVVEKMKMAGEGLGGFLLRAAGTQGRVLRLDRP